MGKPLRMLSDWKLSEKEEENDEISEPTDGAFFFLRSNLFNLSKEDASPKEKEEKEDYQRKLFTPGKAIEFQSAHRQGISFQRKT